MGTLSVYFVLHMCLFLTISSGEPFKEQFSYLTTADDIVTINTTGRIKSTIDLDDRNVIKRWKCSNGVISIALFDGETMSRAWGTGDLVVGSRGSNCKSDEEISNLNTRGVFVKVLHIERFTRYLNLEVIEASAFDLIEEADIRISIKNNTDTSHKRTRKKRHISNVLKSLLTNIDWETNVTTEIPLNPDNTTIQLTKLPGEPLPYLTLSKEASDTNNTESEFYFKCENLKAITELFYDLQIQIDKVNNKPVFKVFMVKAETEFEGRYTISAGAPTNISLSYVGKMFGTEPKLNLRVPIARLERLPVVELIIETRTETYLSINVTSVEPFQVGQDIKSEGTLIMTDEMMGSDDSVSKTSFVDWSSGGNTTVLQSNDMFHLHGSISHKINFQPFIDWSLRDIKMEFGAPYEIWINQQFRTYSTVEDTTYRVDSVSEMISSWSKDMDKLDVEAFDIPIWNINLPTSQRDNDSMCESHIAEKKRANCAHPNIENHSNNSLESVCGAVDMAIHRNSSTFDRLKELFGNIIGFPDENSEADWCGQPGQKCVKCDEDANEICANRLLTVEMAVAVTRLGKFVKSEWPDRQLVLLEGWSELTSRYPQGKYGNSSLYYEGRAATVGLSKTDNSNDTYMLEEDSDVISRFLELISCSGFAYFELAENSSNTYNLCLQPSVIIRNQRKRVATTKELDLEEKNNFLKRLQNLELKSPSTPSPHFDTYSVYPKDAKVTEIVGPVDETYSSDNNLQMKRLMQYPFDDVEFSPEGQRDSACGTPTRRCKQCLKYEENEDPWNWCLTRAMSPRMVLRLRRLAILLKGQSQSQRVKVTVSEDRNDAVWIYQNVGRGLRLENSKSSSLTQKDLANVAITAGFDFIELNTSPFVDVFVKDQAGYKGIMQIFPRATLLEVNPATADISDFMPIYVKEKTAETIPGLLDGTNDRVHLSTYYLVSDFKPINRRYFRLDVRLLECLEEVTSDIDQKLHILAGYKTISMNEENIEQKHDEEKVYFTRGQAVHVAGYNNTDLVVIGTSFIKSCGPVLSSKQMMLGIGCHPTFLYVDIREKTKDESVVIWNVHNDPLYSELRLITDLYSQGGVMVQSKNAGTKCATHPLGPGAFYIKYGDSECSSGGYYPDFCSDTFTNRRAVSSTLASYLWSGAQALTKAGINLQTNQCFLNNCGGCTGKGQLWNQKLAACYQLIKTIIDATNASFPNMTDNSAFFNTENHDSKIHSLACHDDSICVEILPLFSQFIAAVNEKYLPYPDNNIEEMLYGPRDNPSPVLDILEQEMAYRVKGQVRVYIESKDDLSAMDQILKILMVYNSNVTRIFLEITDESLRQFTRSRMQKKIEKWSTAVCPYHSRKVMAPYNITLIPEDRVRRSTERSKDRNKRKADMRNWELDWASRISI